MTDSRYTSKEHEYYVRYYYKDVERSRARQRERAARNAARNKEFLREYKATHPCIECGESDPVVLDFHHRDRTQKAFTVAHRAGRIGQATLLKEIEKCDILCANCHRRHTSRNNDYSLGRPRIKQNGK